MIEQSERIWRKEREGYYEIEREKNERTELRGRKWSSKSEGRKKERKIVKNGIQWSKMMGKVVRKEKILTKRICQVAIEGTKNE